MGSLLKIDEGSLAEVMRLTERPSRGDIKAIQGPLQLQGYSGLVHCRVGHCKITLRSRCSAVRRCAADEGWGLLRFCR